MCIMDDESYFTLAHTNINGNDRFFTSDIEKTPASLKYKPVEKCSQKLLVWCCFSENGITKPYFRPSGLAVNQKVYLDEMIIKRVIPFIEKHHSDGNYIFWPDLASSHYAKSVIEYLREKKVNFVEKADNPANVPEARPIENLWGCLKGMVYKNNWQADNLDQLKTRIVYCWKKLAKDDPELVKRLIMTVRQKVGFIHRNGVIEDR